MYILDVSYFNNHWNGTIMQTYLLNNPRISPSTVNWNKKTKR